MKEKKIKVLMFWFMNDWGLYGRTYEQIAIELSKHQDIREVICILPPKRINGEIAFSRNKVSKDLQVLTPGIKIIDEVSPFYQIRKLINKNYTPIDVLAKFLRLRGYTKNNTILWLFPPHKYIYELIRLIPYKLAVAHIVDNTTFMENREEQIELAKAQYEVLGRYSDLVITSSKINYDIFSQYNEQCYFFENAVDSMFIGDPSLLPCKLKNSDPKLGYVGWISQRTDIDLLEHVAIERPNYNLIIAGPDEGYLSKSKLLNLPNVFYNGPIAYDDIPVFLKNIDICLIPHKDNNYSRSMSPLKLFQYLASGRPIVSTKIAGVERWSDMIEIAMNKDDFIQKIDKSILQDSQRKSTERIAAVKKETWINRVNQMLEVINREMQKQA